MFYADKFIGLVSLLDITLVPFDEIEVSRESLPQVFTPTFDTEQSEEVITVVKTLNEKSRTAFDENNGCAPGENALGVKFNSRKKMVTIWSPITSVKIWQQTQKYYVVVLK